MKPTKKKIAICSISFHEYDRRIQRTILSLKNKYDIAWISRNKSAESIDESYSHHSVNTWIKKGVLFYLEFNLRVFIKLMTSRQDLILSIDLDSLGSCWLTSKLKRKKIVFDAHEIFHELPELEGKKIKKYIWKTLSKFLFPKIAYKYTVNSSLAKIFLHDFNSKFEVIRNVPLLESSNEQLPKLANKTLCYLGVVNKGRGVELAIKTLIELPDYHLLVIGSGDEIESSKQLARELNLEQRIKFCGYVEPAQISALLKQSSIGLNLLDPESDNYKYSLANKFFDYMHAGLPSINMAFPEYEAINNEFEISSLCSDYSTEALINSVSLLESESKYQDLQNNCLIAREKFNWQIEKQRLEDIFSKAFE